MIFLADTLEDYQLWFQAFESYIVQTKNIQTVYDFKDKLGEGSFGVVYLA